MNEKGTYKADDEYPDDHYIDDDEFTKIAIRMEKRRRTVAQCPIQVRVNKRNQQKIRVVTEATERARFPREDEFEILESEPEDEELATGRYESSEEPS